MKIKSVLFFSCLPRAPALRLILMGALGGVAVWEDTVLRRTGDALALRLRKPFVAGLMPERYNFTSYDGYTQNEVLAYALASVDYPLIPRPCSARRRRGGGWLGADGGEARYGCLRGSPGGGRHVRVQTGFGVFSCR